MNKTQYETAVKKGKGYALKISELEKQKEHYWMLLAELSYETCEPFIGGDFKKHHGYTYTDFAKDVGVCRYALANYRKVYVNVYKVASVTDGGRKSPVELTQEQRVAIVKVGKKTKRKTPPKVVDEEIKKELKKSPEEKTLEHNIPKLETIRNVIVDSRVSMLDDDILSVIQTYCEQILEKIYTGKTIIKPSKRGTVKLTKQEWVSILKENNFNLESLCKHQRI